jgi:hypothetical protein
MCLQRKKFVRLASEISHLTGRIFIIATGKYLLMKNV